MTRFLTMMDEIQKLKGEKYDENQVRMLQTLIISSEQISEDF
jgi:hypothetical protein